MTKVNQNTDINNDVWDDLIRKGMKNALNGLSSMVGSEISVGSMAMEHVPAKDLPEILGSPESLVVGVYITYTGASQGHLLLVHQPEVTYLLLDMLLGKVPRKHRQFTELERSAIGEMGNITGTFFLNAVADELRVLLNPSPPFVLMDMAGAIMDIALAEILAVQDIVFVAKTEFNINNSAISSNFIVLPNPGLLKLLPLAVGAAN